MLVTLFHAQHPLVALMLVTRFPDQDLLVAQMLVTLFSAPHLLVALMIVTLFPAQNLLVALILVTLIPVSLLFVSLLHLYLSNLPCIRVTCFALALLSLSASGLSYSLFSGPFHWCSGVLTLVDLLSVTCRKKSGDLCHPVPWHHNTVLIICSLCHSKAVTSRVLATHCSVAMTFLGLRLGRLQTPISLRHCAVCRLACGLVIKSIIDCCSVDFFPC